MRKVFIQLMPYFLMLEKLFNPSSVAVIGASNTPGKVGYSIVKNLIDADFSGEIFPINLKEMHVQGLKAFSNVLDVKKNIDLAVLVIPSKFVPQTMLDCSKKNIKNVVIITAGFSEIGEQGKELEEKVRKIVEQNKMNVVGPNTLGIINTENGLNASFSANFPQQGGVAIVSQSGALCTAILDWSRKEKIGFSKFISTGNKSFLNEKEYFSYLENDSRTKSVFVYMESVKNHKEFLKSAYSLAKKKPVVLIKSGRSLEGQKAASSHTGAMSVDDKIFSIACEKSNIIRMNSIEGFFDMAKLLSKTKNLNKFSLGVVTNAGGPGVIVADSASKHKFPLPEFSKKTLDIVKEINPHASNPLDLIGDAKPIDYRTALSVLQKDDNIDLLYVLLTPQSMTDPDRVADIIVELNNNKPIICSFLGGRAVSHSRRFLSENGVVEFVTPERGIKVLARIKSYSENKKQKKIFNFEKEKIKIIPKKYLNNNFVPMEYAFSILKEFGIKTCKTKFAANEKEFDLKIKELNFPIAMKASSGIPHKTDLGLVKWDIKDVNEAKEIFISMQNILSKMDKPKQIALQENIVGQEVIISSIDNEFGKVITFGLGGIFVEIMKDYSQKIAPINDEDIENMFEKVKGFEVLKGARTGQKYNIEALKQVIKAVSLLALTYSELKEIEMNPIIVNEKGAYAVDAMLTK
jgi:acetate---CoA ligase (ADP-forming)